MGRSYLRVSGHFEIGAGCVLSADDHLVVHGAYVWLTLMCLQGWNLCDDLWSIIYVAVAVKFTRLCVDVSIVARLGAQERLRR